MPKDAAYLQFVNALREKTASQDLVPAMKSMQKFWLAKGTTASVTTMAFGRDPCLPERCHRALALGPCASSRAERLFRANGATARRTCQKEILTDMPEKYVDKILGQYKAAMELTPEQRTNRQ